jgi:hypothetical protein
LFKCWSLLDLGRPRGKVYHCPLANQSNEVVNPASRPKDAKDEPATLRDGLCCMGFPFPSATTPAVCGV